MNLPRRVALVFAGYRLARMIREAETVGTNYLEHPDFDPADWTLVRVSDWLALLEAADE